MTREEAIKTLHELWRETNDSWYEEAYNMAIEALSADAASDAYKRGFDDCKRAYEIELARSADSVLGEWEDKEVFNETDDDHIVDEWQSARCSVCGKYHTTPYMYYFDNFNYCPNCGARMKGGAE